LSSGGEAWLSSAREALDKDEISRGGIAHSVKSKNVFAFYGEGSCKSVAHK